MSLKSYLFERLLPYIPGRLILLVNVFSRDKIIINDTSLIVVSKLRSHHVLRSRVALYRKGLFFRGQQLGESYHLDKIKFLDDDLVVDVGANVGDLILQNNEITTTAGQDLVLDANGAGGVVLGNFKVAGNIITNISSGAVSEFVQTGAGYFKILGTNGVVMPLGTSLEQPSPGIYGILPVGLTRYNTDNKALEIWDGLSWASPAGATGAVSQLEAVDIAAEMALTLG